MVIGFAMTNPMKRPPVVVVMGHVDHGKTSLLDYIRKTNIAAKEAGGITQSVGAYEIEHGGAKITFIDTPGHEAFAKMRARGANIADLAILVVAATDNVQNQTKEAIKVLTETQTPFVVAINKIDKASQQNIEAVKQELMKEGVLLEGYGGSVSWQGVSAKTGEGINELLDVILLAADVEGLEYDPGAPATGYVLESQLDNRRGIIADVIVKNGTLRAGDFISAGSAAGQVKILENFLGKRVEELVPSSPGIIFGFERLPEIGAEFYAGQTETEAATPRVAARAKAPRAAKPDEVIIPLMLKADLGGSLEALDAVIKGITTPANIHIEIIEESVGDVTDGDVKAAIAYGAAILAFRSKITKPAASLALAQVVNIVQSEIIYDLLKAVQEMVAAGTTLKALGELEILAVFGKKGGNQIIGGKVLEGEIKNGASVDIERQEKVAGKGRIINLQSQKRDVARVLASNECGMLFSSETEVKVGDKLIARA
jgi:translation initiation factor IF-2